MRMHGKAVIWFLVMVAALLLAQLAGCARNPVTGKQQIALISEEQEIQYGRESHPQVLQQYGQVEDRELQAYVNGIGQRLARVSHRPQLEWHFTVVDVPVVNAFALPGGYLYLTREILTYMNNEAELAGVLGHEIGHVTARHSVSQISRAQLFSLGLGVGSIISPTFQQLSGLAETGLGLLFLKHGRDDERQSDELGVQYMTEIGYDPRAFAEFFKVFQALQEESGQVLPNWLSTHPAPPDRIERTLRNAQAAIAQKGSDNLSVDRPGFLRQVEGVVFGENPREGFMQDGWFLHPELRFRIRFPQEWRVQNTRSVVAAVDPGGAAAIQLMLAKEQASPEDYAATLNRQQGIRMLDGQRTLINGNPAFLGAYEVLDPNSGRSMGVLAAFISFRGNLYQVAGLTAVQNLRAASRIFETSLRSFDQLDDPAALNAQPDRVRLHTTRTGDTLRRLAERVGNRRVAIDQIALLNRLEPNEPLKAGLQVKLIEPGRR